MTLLGKVTHCVVREEDLGKLVGALIHDSAEFHVDPWGCNWRLSFKHEGRPAEKLVREDAITVAEEVRT